MRLILQGQKAPTIELPILWALYTQDDYFETAPYLVKGYDTIDYYVIGGGSAGNIGGNGYYLHANSPGIPTGRGGGGGGGGGGGELSAVIGEKLATMLNLLPISVGAGGTADGSGSSGVYGYDSTFNNVVARGGTFSTFGESGSSARNGYGGAGADAGGAVTGSGTGGRGATVTNDPDNGLNGVIITTPKGFKIPGGGGGGGGIPAKNFDPALLPGFKYGAFGGGGWHTTGYRTGRKSDAFGWYDSSFVAGGDGGGGGSGHDLTRLSRIPGLTGVPDVVTNITGKPGGGGGGGSGGYGGFTDGTSSLPNPGARGYDGEAGCVLIRIYRS